MIFFSLAIFCFAFYLVQKKWDVPSWPTYQPTQNRDVINGCSLRGQMVLILVKAALNVIIVNSYQFTSLGLQ